MSKLSVMPTAKLVAQYSRKLGLVLTLANVGLIVCLVLWFALPGPLSRHRVVELTGKDTTVHVNSELLSAKSVDFPDKLVLVIKRVDLDKRLAEGVFGVACVDRIVATYSAFSHAGIYAIHSAVLDPESILNGPMCVQNDEPNEERFNETDHMYESGGPLFALDWMIELPVDPVTYAYHKYPYDYITIAVDFVFEGQIRPYTDNSIHPFKVSATHVIETRLPGWEAYELIGPSEPSASMLVLRRSLLVRILTPSLIALVFLVTVLLPLVESFGTAVEIVVVLVLGVWGIRQILLPNGSPGPTMIDTLLLIEYGALVLALIGTVIRHLSAMWTNLGEPRQSMSDSYRYVGLIHSNVYHMVGCRHVTACSTSEFIKYQDRDQAERAGKRPCRTCLAGELSRIDE